jgi:hypothetical protein
MYIITFVYDTLKSSSNSRKVEPWFVDNNDIGVTCMTSQLMYLFSVNSKNSVRFQRGAIRGKGNRFAQKKYDKISWHCLKEPILNILGVSHTPIPQTISLTVFFLNLYAYYTVSYIILVK